MTPGPPTSAPWAKAAAKVEADARVKSTGTKRKIAEATGADVNEQMLVHGLKTELQAGIAKLWKKKFDIQKESCSKSFDSRCAPRHCGAVILRWAFGSRRTIIFQCVFVC